MGLFDAAKKLGDAAQSVAEKATKTGEKIAAKGSEVIEQASQTSVGHTVIQMATSVGAKVQEGAQNVANSHIGMAVGNATNSAAQWSSEQIANAAAPVGRNIDSLQLKLDKQSEQKEEERHKRTAQVKRELSNTIGTSMLKALGQSPTELNYVICDKAKNLFPIPREQEVLWMDAEFDLRPSGVVITDQGVFIKTDEDALHKDDLGQSKLFYLRWDSFDPAWFLEDGERNMAWGVNVDCRSTFIRACRTLAERNEPGEAALAEAEQRYGAASTPDTNTVQDTVDISATLNITANTMLSEEAVIAQHHAHAAGHGEMAEDVITMLDRLHGMDAKVVGRDNALNGADREVNGMLVQTKYYKTPRGTLNSAFDPSTKMYRYLAPDGSPMQLEVPRDQYEQVLTHFKDKISRGEVPGVTNPEEASNIVRRGRLTYKQAVNLTKPGTVESLAYDAATGAVVCTCAFGLSFLATAYSAYRENGDLTASVQAGFMAGAEVFGLTFVQHMITNQLARTGLAKAFISPTQYFTANILGSRGSATIVNGIRALTGKQAIHGAAATKHLAKIMRNNIITSAISFAVFSIPDTMRMADRKITSAQYTKNLVTLASSMVGAAAGSIGAGMAAAKVAAISGTAVAPGVGTVVGFAGGMVGGVVGSMVVKNVADLVYEDDAVRIGRFFNAMVSCLSSEYLLSAAEMDVLIETLNSISADDMKNVIMDTVQADVQEQVVREFLEPKFDDVIAHRAHFALPAEAQVDEAVMEIVDIVSTD